MREFDFAAYGKKWLLTTKGEGGGDAILLSRQPLVVKVRLKRPYHWSMESPDVWTQILATLDAAKACFPEVLEWEMMHLPNQSKAPSEEWNIVLTPHQRNIVITKLMLPDQP